MEERLSICVFGDSIAWGAYDPAGGWVQRLRNYIEANVKEYTEVYNLGVDGDTTAGVLVRFPVECAARGATTIIFAIGSNDAGYLGQPENCLVPLDRYRANLERLAALAKKVTGKVFFLDLGYVDEKKSMPVPSMADLFYSNSILAEYGAVLKATIETAGCRLISLSNSLGDGDLDDGVHPNAAGHEIIFRAVKAALEAGGELN